MTLDQQIDAAVKPLNDVVNAVVFYPLPLPGGAEVPFIVAWLVLAGLFATFYTGFVGLRHFAHGWDLSFNPKHQVADATKKGEISNFQALAGALAGTIGLGNIAGVAVALSVGGPGATFWMILMGFLGMNTKFMEATLGVKYREQQADGQLAGGPSFFLQNGLRELGMPKLGKFLAACFAVFMIVACLGGGNMFQVNQTFEQFLQITGGAESFWADKGWLFGAINALLAGVIIIGGLKKVAGVSSWLVPLMAIVYIAASLVVIMVHIDKLPWAVQQIVSHAFSFEAGLGGFLGAIIQGVRRAVFSNESGIGTCAIIHGVARSTHPAQQGMVAMLGAFLDTVVVCTMTALVIIITGSLETAEAGKMSGMALTNQAFTSVMPWFSYVLFVVVFMFAFSTIIGYGYYAEVALRYLFGANRAIHLTFCVVYCLTCIVGASANLANIIDFSDGLFFLLAIPNVIGLVLLRKVVRAEYERYKVTIQ